MAEVSQLFNHNTPSAPTRALGALLGTSGVSLPAAQTIGTLSGTSSADGSFSDTSGYGQIDYDSSGRLYVADTNNNRIKRFVLTNGVWTYDSKFTSVVTVLGGGSSPALMAIDRTANEIHVAAFDHLTASNWISVWSLSHWPSLTTLNRVRQYGANANSNVVDRATGGISLAIEGNVAIVTSSGGSFRVISWNHQTGAVVNQATKAAIVGRFAVDGSGNWWAAQSSGSEIGFRKFNSSFAATARLGNATVSLPRTNRLLASTAGFLFYYDGKVYGKDQVGQVLGYTASSGAYLDQYTAPGSLGSSNEVTGFLGQTNGSLTADKYKGSVVVDPNGGAWLVAWENNANNATTNCFLIALFIGTATATWTKTDWSAGTNTLKSLSVKGSLLAGEKYKIRLRKNAGSWITVTENLLQDEATLLSVGTFTEGDSLTVELSISPWTRLDGHATLAATKCKLSPTNVAVLAHYEDTAANNYIPQQTGALQGRLTTGGLRGRISA